MNIRDPQPEIHRLEELIDSIRKGEIRLPKFQRPFVWTKSDILELFDSIYNGYPIGSILLWHSSERLKSEREIIGFKLSEDNKENYPTDYLLDGQQRLTSLCAILYWDGDEDSSIWNMSFDLDEERFLYTKDVNRVNYFPMNKLLSTSDFIKQCMKFENSKKASVYYNKSERLLKSFKDYKIAVVKIGDVSLEEVAPIFERINSTGRKLTIVDLMRAATWKNGFDLTEAINKISSKYSDVFGEIPDTLILRMIAAAVGLGVNKSDIDQLRQINVMQLNNAIIEINESLLLALDFLDKKIGLIHYSYLPYGMQLIFIVEYFRINKESNKEKLDKLSQWFWRTSFSNYFGGASTGQLSKDLINIRQFAENKSNDIILADTIIEMTELLMSDFNLRNASSKVFILMIIRKYNIINEVNSYLKDNTIKLSRRNCFESVAAESQYNGRNISQIYIPFSKERKSEFNSSITTANYLNIEIKTEDDYLLNDEVLKNRANVLLMDAVQLTGLNFNMIR